MTAGISAQADRIAQAAESSHSSKHDDALAFFIEPSDVWLFRDGRPFDAGSDHRARSVFPPAPSVIQGALRTAYLARRGVSLNDYLAYDAPGASPEVQAIVAEIGVGSSYGHLRLRGPFVASFAAGRLVRYYPAPLDLGRDPGAGGAYSRLPLSDLQSQAIEVSPVRGASAEDMRWLPGAVVHAGREKGLWMQEDALLRYLAYGDPPADGDLKSSAELFAPEPRTGLGIDNSLAAGRDGLLYEAEFVRTHRRVGLMIEATGLGAADWGGVGRLTLGGERRIGYYTALTTEESAPLPALTDLQGDFCLYVATPAYLDGGWQPANANWSQLFGGAPEALASLKLVGAVVPRPLAIGGIDLAASTRRGAGHTIVHKPARMLVPAGSIYYFSCDGSVRLKNDALCSGGDWQIGFGQVIPGRWL